MSNRVWMHLGVELDLTETELDGLNSGQYDPQQLLKLIQSCRCAIVGESYFPVIEQNGRLGGAKWTLPRTTAARFFVDTPDGVLLAQKAGGIDYPGVEVELITSESDAPNITLSLTEYIPGGEGACDFDLSHPDGMARQWAEIPPERRQVNKDGRMEVNAGFITRGWPNEVSRQEDHQRIFHYGYK